MQCSEGEAMKKLILLLLCMLVMLTCSCTKSESEVIDSNSNTVKEEINSPIVGIWQFYKKSGQVLEGQEESYESWIFVFNEDGTYKTYGDVIDHDPITHGVLTLADYWGSGTYSIVETTLTLVHDDTEKESTYKVKVDSDADGTKQLIFLSEISNDYIYIFNKKPDDTVLPDRPVADICDETIDSPIVGAWKYYLDNARKSLGSSKTISNWRIVFNPDGTYESYGDYADELGNGKYGISDDNTTLTMVRSDTGQRITRQISIAPDKDGKTQLKFLHDDRTKGPSIVEITGVTSSDCEVHYLIFDSMESKWE